MTENAVWTELIMCGWVTPVGWDMCLRSSRTGEIDRERLENPGTGDELHQPDSYKRSNAKEPQQVELFPKLMTS